jgi:hypothetical protein
MNSRIVLPPHIATNEGRHRYSQTYGYFPDLSSAPRQPDMSLPCSCTVLCAPRCAGECCCAACNLQFAIWADEAGHSGPEALRSQEEQLKLYRGEV